MPYQVTTAALRTGFETSALEHLCALVVFPFHSIDWREPDDIFSVTVMIYMYLCAFNEYKHCVNLSLLSLVYVL